MISYSDGKNKWDVSEATVLKIKFDLMKEDVSKHNCFKKILKGSDEGV
jgi:hypothetical protein